MDGPQFGASPLPWDIPVSMPQRFTDRVEKVRVPHSSIVKVLLGPELGQTGDSGKDSDDSVI